MLEDVFKIAEEDPYSKDVLELFEDPLFRCLEATQCRKKLCDMCPELAKYLPKEMVLKINNELLRYPVSEIKGTFELLGFDEWYKEMYGITVEEADKRARA